jgi:hypothetical protein
MKFPIQLMDGNTKWNYWWNPCAPVDCNDIEDVAVCQLCEWSGI